MTHYHRGSTICTRRIRWIKHFSFSLFSSRSVIRRRLEQMIRAVYCSVHLLYYYMIVKQRASREQVSVICYVFFFSYMYEHEFFFLQIIIIIRIRSFLYRYTGRRIIIRTSSNARACYIRYIYIHIYYLYTIYMIPRYDDNDDGGGGTCRAAGVKRKKNQQCIILCIHVEYLNIKRRTYYIIIVLWIQTNTRCHGVN